MRASRAFVAVLAAGVALVATAPAGADGPNHQEPVAPAPAHFPADFPVLNDTEWGFRLGGFGGVAQGADRRHVPVILIHGNTTDHGDWYPVRDDFRSAGWTDQELWAVSYNGVGCNFGGDANGRDNPEAEAERAEAGGDDTCRQTHNEINVADLHQFILAVRSYTGSARFSIVGHSLGVTVARRTLQVHPELRRDLVAFVGVAGANHGTSVCGPGSENFYHGCEEIQAGSAWLEQLNGPDGTDETYAPAKWLTVYDGSGAADIYYSGPSYAESPALKGADNRQFGLAHNDLRVDPSVVAEYRTFLEETEAALVDAAPEPSPAPPAAAAPSAPASAPSSPPPPSVSAPKSAAAPTAPSPVAAPELAAAGPPAARRRDSSSSQRATLAQPAVIGGSSGGADAGPYRLALVGLLVAAVGAWRLNERVWPRRGSAPANL